MSSPSARKAPESFVVMAKPVGSACNMNCAYCYYLHNPVSSSSGIMSLDTLEQMILGAFRSLPGPVASFVWHGGEPVLAGLDFYRRAVELQRKYLPEGWECWNNLQTNGLALDEEWCRFLQHEHFDVGISIDGTRLVHDAFRADAAGRPTFDRVAANIRLLQQHGIQPDLLCTVNVLTAEHATEVYRTLRDFGTGWLQFIPVIGRGSDGRLSEHSVTPEQYGSFLMDVFSEWFFHDLDRTEVQLFSETARMLSGSDPSLCWLRESCGDVPVVEKDGSVYACDHFVLPEYRRGSIRTDSLQDLVSSESQRRFGAQKKEALTGFCRACPWLFLCHGGCPKDRFTLSPEGEPGQYALCAGLRTWFSYAVPRLRRAMELSAMGKTQHEIMNMLTLEEREKVRNISRNDPCPCGSGKKYKQCCMRRCP